MRRKERKQVPRLTGAIHFGAVHDGAVPVITETLIIAFEFGYGKNRLREMIAFMGCEVMQVLLILLLPLLSFCFPYVQFSYLNLFFL